VTKWRQLEDVRKRANLHQELEAGNVGKSSRKENLEREEKKDNFLS